MRLLLINPNTSEAMTAGIAEAARAVAAPGTVVQAVQPSFGPRSIEGHYDEAIAAAGVAEQVRAGAPWLTGDARAGVVIACFGDPGLDAAREATDVPVIGIAEAAFHVASLLATGFSVVTTMTRTCVIAEHLVMRHGFERRCRFVLRCGCCFHVMHLVHALHIAHVMLAFAIVGVGISGRKQQSRCEEESCGFHRDVLSWSEFGFDCYG